ncbi:MAG: hypothetical protein HC826_00915 [Rhodospirillales bacterium]|nr:hypothetical protein [Rhodospirillales bacterium]
MGLSAGESKSATITFPDDFAQADLAGTTVSYEVTVKELRQRDPVVLDDELAKKLGAESLEQLTKDIREHHERELKSMSRMKLKRALLDKLDELYTFPLPKGLVEREFETITRRMDGEKGGAPQGEESEGENGAQPADDRDSLSDEGKEGDAEHSTAEREEYHELAKRRVRLGLVLAEIGQRNNLRVSPEEIGKAMVAEAQRYPGQEKNGDRVSSQERRGARGAGGPIAGRKGGRLHFGDGDGQRTDDLRRGLVARSRRRHYLRKAGGLSR